MVGTLFYVKRHIRIVCNRNLVACLAVQRTKMLPKTTKYSHRMNGRFGIGICMNRANPLSVENPLESKRNQNIRHHSLLMFAAFATSVHCLISVEINF